MKDWKKISVALLIAIISISSAAAVAVAASSKVKNTVHNLSTSGSTNAIYSINEKEVCIFCHTPHNAVLGKKFIWNRFDSTANFQLYTSSPSLNFNRAGVSISNVSKMCMSCHDGGTALNAMARVYQTVNMFNGVDELGDIYCGDACGMGPGYESPQPNLGEGVGDGSFATDVTPGGLLTNDHPISFIYSQSAAGDTQIKALDPGGKSVGGLPLWASDDGSGNMRLECVTCHDPHIDYNLPSGDVKLKPFLRKSNESSSLCFTCHNK